MRTDRILELNQRMLAIHCATCGEHKDDCTCGKEPIHAMVDRVLTSCSETDEHIYIPECHRRPLGFGFAWVKCLFCGHWSLEKAGNA